MACFDDLEPDLRVRIRHSLEFAGLGLVLSFALLVASTTHATSRALIPMKLLHLLFG